MAQSVRIGSASTKGGSGKSQIAFQVATEAARAGCKTLILDCDERQNSIYVLSQALRGSTMPVVRTASYDKLLSRIAEGEREGFEYIFADCPPGDGQFVNLIVSQMDLVLVPVRGTTFDLHALINTIELLARTVDVSFPVELRAANALQKAAIVLNGLPTTATSAEMKDIKGALRQCGAGELEIIGILHERPAYVTALAKGLGVTEYGGDAEATKEVEQLFRKVRARMQRKAAAVESLSKSRKVGARK